MTVHTRPGAAAPPAGASPTLLYRKWHAYDRFTAQTDSRGQRPKTLKAFETKSARKAHSRAVISSLDVSRGIYADWHRSFKAGCEAVSGRLLTRTYATAWRLVIGWGTNPALETGLDLHYLLGFPYIPGSAVKGLLHHLAEMKLMDGDIPSRLPGDQTNPPVELGPFLDSCRQIRAIFGSLTAQQAQGENGAPIGPETPWARLSDWKEFIEKRELTEHEAWVQDYARILELVDAPGTGGMIDCFDAVPSRRAMREARAVLDVDILNSHYPEYYSDPTVNLPTDDQNPNPITFLAVPPGVDFEFRIRLREWPCSPGRNDEEVARAVALQGLTPDLLEDLIVEWLRTALTEWGIGAKTVAGYGYFVEPEYTAAAETHVEAGSAPEGDLPATPIIDDPVMREAMAYLPPGLTHPNVVADRIDKVRSLDAKVQGAVAGILREHYPSEIEKWRKKGSPAVKKRVAWLDAFSGA